VAALELYEKLRQMLRNELGEDTAPETVALVEAIQAGKIGAETPRPVRVVTEAGPAAAGNGQQIEPPVVSAARPASSFNRKALAVVGTLSLIAGLVFTSSRLIKNNQFAEAAATGSTDRRETVSQTFAGTNVKIFGPYFHTYADLFAESMLPFEDLTGIDIVFVSGEEDDVDDLMGTKDEPDIVIFPQPGRLAELARQGKIVDIRTFLDEEYLQQQYPEAFLELATVDNHMVGAWYSAGVKSLVWYPKQAFEAKGYEVPETWDELMALSDRIVKDGGTPWCIGINNPDAPGWVGTDWVEDILLRTASPETYDAWVRHDLPFNSPPVRRAFEIMGKIWLNDEYIYGGTANILEEDLRESATRIFDDPPACYLHRQGSFVILFFPPWAEYGQDYDFFYLPPIDTNYGKPVLGGGDIFGMINDRPEVREVMRYITTPESARVMIQHGGFLSPHRTTPIEWFPTEADLRFAQIILSADTYRFDGSDLMPDSVGFGSFFRGITRWIEGADLDTVLQEIDASWP
jgi:alpha-glucoside transport system substrate-binding protein